MEQYYIYFKIAGIVWAVGAMIVALVYWRAHVDDQKYARRPLKFLFDSVGIGLLWPFYLLFMLIAAGAGGFV